MTDDFSNIVKQVEQKESQRQYILKGFKDGVTDAILNGSVDDDNRHDYYKQGYDFGISLYAELMVQNDFFKEKRIKTWQS